MAVPIETTFKSERTWTEWLRLGIEIIFACIIIATWAWLALESQITWLTLLFSLATAVTIAIVARLTYLEATGISCRLTNEGLAIRGRWFGEDLFIAYDEMVKVSKIDTGQAIPNVFYIRELDARELDSPLVYFGWPSRLGLLEIKLKEMRRAKYKLPQDFDARDIIQAIPWRWRRITAEFTSIILSVLERDRFLKALDLKIKEREESKLRLGAEDVDEVTFTA